MKKHDFLPNLILILLTGLLFAGVGNIAARGAIPVTYTSQSEAQLVGDDVHISDVGDFLSLVTEDEAIQQAVIAELDLQNAKKRTLTAREFSEYLTVTSLPEEGIIDIIVCTSDPYMSRDIAHEIVSIAGTVYESSHEGISVNLVKAASAAIVSDSRPILACTFIGGLIGLLAGACLTYLILKSGRATNRPERVDPRYKKIEEEGENDEEVYEELFADDNEDVDPEMRELYRIAREAEAGKGKEMPEEAGAAYREAMEIEAMAADEDFTGDGQQKPLYSDAETAEMKHAASDGEPTSKDAASDREHVGVDKAFDGDPVSVDTASAGDLVSVDEVPAGESVIVDDAAFDGESVSVDTASAGDPVCVDEAPAGDPVSVDTASAGDPVSVDAAPDSGPAGDANESVKGGGSDEI